MNCLIIAANDVNIFPNLNPSQSSFLGVKFALRLLFLLRLRTLTSFVRRLGKKRENDPKRNQRRRFLPRGKRKRFRLFRFGTFIYSTFFFLGAASFSFLCAMHWQEAVTFTSTRALGNDEGSETKSKSRVISFVLVAQLGDPREAVSQFERDERLKNERKRRRSAQKKRESFESNRASPLYASRAGQGKERG